MLCVAFTIREKCNSLHLFGRKKFRRDGNGINRIGKILLTHFLPLHVHLCNTESHSGASLRGAHTHEHPQPREYVQETFIRHLLCTRHCSRCLETHTPLRVPVHRAPAAGESVTKARSDVQDAGRASGLDNEGSQVTPELGMGLPWAGGRLLPPQNWLKQKLSNIAEDTLTFITQEIPQVWGALCKKWGQR